MHRRQGHCLTAAHDAPYAGLFTAKPTANASRTRILEGKQNSIALLRKETKTACTQGRPQTGLEQVGLSVGDTVIGLAFLGPEVN